MRTALMGIVTAGILAGAVESVAQGIIGAKAETLTDLRLRLAAIERQLSAARTMFTGDEEMVRLRAASRDAAAALQQAQRAAEEAEAALKAAIEERVRTHPRAVALRQALAQADKRCQDLTARLKAVEAEIAQLTEVADAREKMEEARRAYEAARNRKAPAEETAQALRAYIAANRQHTDVLTSKTRGGGAWVALSKELTAATAEQRRLSYKYRTIYTVVVQDPAIWQAAEGIERAEEAFAKSVAAAVAGDAAAAQLQQTLNMLGPRRPIAEQRMREVEAQIAKSPEVAAARQAVADAQKDYQQKYKAYYDRRAKKATETAQGARLKAELGTADAARAAVIRGVLAAIESRLRTSDAEIVALRTARDQAASAVSAAEEAVKTTIEKLKADNTEYQGLTKLLKDLAEAEAAMKQLVGKHRDSAALSGPRRVVADARKALAEAQAAAVQRAEQRMAADPAGARLLQQRAEVLEKIKAQAGPK